MKIKCLKNVCASGISLEAGQTYDVSETDAELLISMGRVEVYTPKPKVKKIINGISRRQYNTICIP